MSLVVFVVVTFGAAGAGHRASRRGARGDSPPDCSGWRPRSWRPSPSIRPRSLVIGGAGVATSAYLRLFLLLGSVVGLGLAVAGLAAGTRRDAPAVTLAILGAAALTLVSWSILAARSWPRRPADCSASWSRSSPRGGRAGATVGILEARAVVVAGALAIAATAWFGRDLSQLDAPSPWS